MAEEHHTEPPLKVHGDKLAEAFIQAHLVNAPELPPHPSAKLPGRHPAAAERQHAHNAV
ncbi:hypothetical protein ACTI_77040 [Actinoplanes sp. OR16]|uniref:hypothetical protein n=1 Tax=Actinoplanes sp. OR16 TaxID=946334 RepID=UPI000F70F318|nr:hypothetical protein [Actinoplanes sp. OR16]BBH71019.1 hypothetical protein ACTI_77040 [Actinoplanes sp. OR16]